MEKGVKQGRADEETRFGELTGDPQSRCATALLEKGGQGCRAFLGFSKKE